MHAGPPIGENAERLRFYYAEKAGEAFIAAARADSVELQMLHRSRAIEYVDILREMSARPGWD